MNKLALISDIHSNVAALQAVFQRIDQLGVQEVACLGDVVGYGADPAVCVRMVMERCKWTIMGNHDWGLFNSVNDFNPLAQEALHYTRKHLQPSFFRRGRRQVWEFLRDLPQSMFENGFLFYHGSPRDPIMEYVLRSDQNFDPEKLRDIFGMIDRPAFVGHTHIPGMHKSDFSFTTATDQQHSFVLDGQPCIVNVGSVGQPRDGDPRASFAVVSWPTEWPAAGNAEVEFHRVEYDIPSTQSKILAAGLHPALADRLGKGK